MGGQPDPLRRRRLARSRGRNADHPQQLAIPNGADRLLSGERTEQAAHQTRVTTEAVLWILAVGRYVERVVPHPAREDADGLRDLVRSQIPDLDGHARARAVSSMSVVRKASEKVGKGWITSATVSSGTRARMASVACWSHSPASAPARGPR